MDGRRRALIKKALAAFKKNDTKSVTREYIEAIVVAFVLAMIIRTFVVQAFKIPSGSMLHTLEIGDHILVNKFIYKITKPTRGDLMVFKYPKDLSRDFIKRLVGLPGDTIEIKHRQVYINGEAYKENYTIFQFKDDYPEARGRDNFGPITIPPHNYFMMGDNRDNSSDSRFWGTLDEKLVEGKAVVIYWSIIPNEMLSGTHSWAEDVSDFVISLPSIGSRIRWERIGKMLY